MKCEFCGQPKTLLFLSYVCDHCAGDEASAPVYRGFVVYRPARHGSEFVFRDRAAAAQYQQMRGLEAFEIREVWSREEIPWFVGDHGDSAIEVADRLFEIFPDSDCPSGVGRAYLAPEQAKAA